MTDCQILAVSLQGSPAAGGIRALGAGDHVSVFRSATRRDDWPPISVALMVAFSRGADLVFADDS